MPPQTAEQVAALESAGDIPGKEEYRYYPAGEMTAHLAGFTNVDDKGQEGVELAFQDALLGRPARTVIRDRRGNIIEDVGATRPPRDGKIALAIDLHQYIAYSHLNAGESKAKGGGVVVMDAHG